MAFALAKPPVKISKTTQVTKNKGATSSNDKGDLKMISIHRNFIEVIRDPFCENKFFNLMPRSIVAENLYDKSLKNPSKISSARSRKWMKKTKLRSYMLCLARGVK